MKKLKALVFYQYLPPWRVDIFNEMGTYYDMTIVFTNANSEGFTYNREELLEKLQNIKTLFLNSGFKVGSRVFRVGVLKILKQYKPDVVFSHEYSPTSILIALYKQLSICRYNYYLTTSDNLQMAETSSGLKAKARSYVLHQANGMIVYSESVKQWYTNHFPNLRISICPNIQNPETLLSYRKSFDAIIKQHKKQYNIGEESIILYIGRLVHIKGIDLLLNAFAKAQTDNTKLVIVGNGNERTTLENIAKTLHIDNKVIFGGYHEGIELYAWYEIAHFFILPSRYEPFGAVVNEALVYGCPVVASNYIGALDFINSSNGTIFNPLDENEFIETLNKSISKYTEAGKNRENLMLHSFNQYVKCFYSINQ